jgi:hypothetical protein
VVLGNFLAINVTLYGIAIINAGNNTKINIGKNVEK